MFLADLAKRLDEAPRGERSGLVDEAARRLGVSSVTVYNRLKKTGWSSGRKRRADQGRSKVTDEEARIVADVLSVTVRENGKLLMTVKDAVEIARANGLIESDAAPNTYVRRMRGLGCHPEQLARQTPHTEMASRHPNHVWQFDVSICVLYWAPGGLRVMDERKFYKNKPGNVQKVENLRALRYLATDHYSGAFFVKYYAGRGENQEQLFDFLMEAFSRREAPGDPFHGVPEMLIWDAGSANTSHMIQNLLDRLTVRHQPHLPGNPRAKGQVERTHELVERGFESRLRFEAVQSIEQLNAEAHLWMRAVNATAEHSRHGKTRYGLWQTIHQTPGALRICPPREVCEQLLTTKPETRKVRGDLTISFNGRTYSVEQMERARVGEALQVVVNPYRAPNIFILDEDRDGNEVRFECAPVERNSAGFRVDAPVFGEGFRAPADTDVDRERKRALKHAYGADTLQEADRAREGHAVAFGGRIDAMAPFAHPAPTRYIERAGTPIEVARPFAAEAAPLTVIEALRRINGRLGRPVTKEENTRVREWYPEGVPEPELDTLVDRLLGIAHPGPQSAAIHP